MNMTLNAGKLGKDFWDVIQMYCSNVGSNVHSTCFKVSLKTNKGAEKVPDPVFINFTI